MCVESVSVCRGGECGERWCVCVVLVIVSGVSECCERWCGWSVVVFGRRCS